MLVRKEYKSEFKSHARTLSPEEVFGPFHKIETGEFSFTHESGWTIKGKIWEDYCYQVNEFEATHPVFGWIRGDFEHLVEAKSKKAFEHFLKYHHPYEWDYYDI